MWKRRKKPFSQFNFECTCSLWRKRKHFNKWRGKREFWMGQQKIKTNTWHLTWRNETKIYFLYTKNRSNDRFHVSSYMRAWVCFWLWVYRKLMKCVRFALKTTQSGSSNINHDRRHRNTFKQGVHLAQLQFCQLKLDGKIVNWYDVPCSILNCPTKRAFVVRFGTWRIQCEHATPEPMPMPMLLHITHLHIAMMSMSTSRTDRFQANKKSTRKIGALSCEMAAAGGMCVLFEFMPSRNPMESQYPIEMFRMKCRKPTHTNHTYLLRIYSVPF